MNRASAVAWSEPASDRDLDNDALDHSRQSRDRLFERRIAYGLYRVIEAPEGNWAKVGARPMSSLTSSQTEAFDSREGRAASNWSSDISTRAALAFGVARTRSRARSATTSTSRSSPAITSPTTPAPASSTPRPATAARTSSCGWRAGALLAERHIDTRIPYTVDENGAFTAEAPGFVGKRVLTDKGEPGDANKAVIDALIAAGALIARGKLKHQYPHSWRSKKPIIFRNTPQWFIAMDKPIAGRAASLRETALRAIGETRWAPAVGREPHPRHGVGQARLGDEPPARLGRADRRLRQEGRPRNPDRRKRQRAHRRRLRSGRRRRLVRRGRGAALPRARPRSRRLRQDRRHSRRLVRFRLDPRLRARRRAPFPRSRRHQAQDRRRRRRSDVSRRLRPAPRLVPVVAARKLRHPRPRALRRRADARLHARREGPQDVEVARQPDLPAGRHQAIGRRHPAAVGGERRLFRRPAHRPGNPQERLRQLPQTAQLAALDARHARPSAARAARRRPAEGVARAADAAPLEPSSTRSCARPMPTSTTPRSSPRWRAS